MTYRSIGQYIVEYEQKGLDRAEYSSGLLQKLSDDLIKKFGKGFSHDNLNNMRKFYLGFPKYETLSRKFKLSRSHYVYLMGIKDDNERKFYTIEANNSRWSLRELKRQCNSAVYERLVLSKDKEKVKELAEHGHIITSANDVIKDPYILEFI